MHPLRHGLVPDLPAQSRHLWWADTTIGHRRVLYPRATTPFPPVPSRRHRHRVSDDPSRRPSWAHLEPAGRSPAPHRPPGPRAERLCRGARVASVDRTPARATQPRSSDRPGPAPPRAAEIADVVDGAPPTRGPSRSRPARRTGPQPASARCHRRARVRSRDRLAHRLGYARRTHRAVAGPVRSPRSPFARHQWKGLGSAPEPGFRRPRSSPLSR